MTSLLLLHYCQHPSLPLSRLPSILLPFLAKQTQTNKIPQDALRFPFPVLWKILIEVYFIWEVWGLEYQGKRIWKILDQAGFSLSFSRLPTPLPSALATPTVLTFLPAEFCS